jgi:hypothetical protein
MDVTARGGARAVLAGVRRPGGAASAASAVVALFVLLLVLPRGVRRAILRRNNLTLSAHVFSTRISYDDERRVTVTGFNRRPHVMAVVAQNVVRMPLVFVVKDNGGG